jgi:hypothetical protein
MMGRGSKTPLPEIETWQIFKKNLVKTPEV